MAKKPEKKKGPIAINEFDLNKFFVDEGIDSIVKDKPLSWIPFSPVYNKILGVPGAAKGFLTLFRGYSNTGKSTAGYEAMASCQKLGILPVYIDTENNFSWEHAKDIGVMYNEVKNEYGEIINYSGNFIFVDNDTLLKKYGKYDYDECKEKKECRTEAVLEDVASLIDDLLKAQADGKLPFELCFIWDSIGSLNCFKSVKSNSKNNMWNAGALETAFKSIINHKIPSSKKEGKEYTNTFIGIQKIWLDSMQGAGVVKHKGGEAFYYAARMIVHMGGITSHGTSSLKATSSGRDYDFGISTNIKCVKNQINGIQWEGKIGSSPTGFMDPIEKAEYVKTNKELLLSKFIKDDMDDDEVNSIYNGDIDIIEEQSDSALDDMYSGN